MRSINSLDALSELIRQWSMDRNLDIQPPQRQMTKVLEEVGELKTALDNNDEAMIIDAIGDTFVTLVILAQQLDYDFNDCVLSAYDEISGRTGKIIDGVFVKSEDLAKE